MLKSVSRSIVSDSEIPWTVAHQVPLPMGFPSQELPLQWVSISSPGDLSNSGIKPRSPALKAVSLPSEPPGEFPTATLKGLNYKSKTHSMSQQV